MSTRKRAKPQQTSVAIAKDRGALDQVLALAPAPLLPDEDEEAFIALAERVVFAAAPADAIEEILIRDVIDLTWEVLRLRRIKVGLLNASLGEGVQQVLDRVGYGGDFNSHQRRGLSERWAAGGSRAKSEVETVLGKAGLSLSEVTAQTVDYKLYTFERLDNMLASSEARRNNALREIDRHRETLGAAARRAVEDAEDVEYREVDTDVIGKSREAVAQSENE